MNGEDAVLRRRNTRIWLHVSYGAPLAAETRLEAELCDRCSALIPAARAARHRHLQWHHSVDGRTTS